MLTEYAFKELELVKTWAGFVSEQVTSFLWLLEYGNSLSNIQISPLNINTYSGFHK
jgi:hypothetical protein